MYFNHSIYHFFIIQSRVFCWSQWNFWGLSHLCTSVNDEKVKDTFLDISYTKRWIKRVTTKMDANTGTNTLIERLKKGPCEEIYIDRRDFFYESRTPGISKQRRKRQHGNQRRPKETQYHNTSREFLHQQTIIIVKQTLMWMKRF